MANLFGKVLSPYSDRIYGQSTDGFSYVCGGSKFGSRDSQCVNSSFLKFLKS